MVKSKRGEVGDNSSTDKLLVSYVERLSDIAERKEALRAEEKECLNEAKESGFLKTSLKKAVKDIRQTEEQRQSQDEIQKARVEYVRVCKELGLFVPDEDDKEAA